MAAAETELEALQASARKWLDIRLETSRLQSDWSWQKQLMESTLTALELEVERLEEEEALLQARVAADTNQNEVLQVEIDQLESAYRSIEALTERTLAALRDLRPTLPPRLSDALSLGYLSLEDTELTVAERLQLAVTLLNRCIQFNSAITYSSEIIQLEEGSDGSIMEVLYWGLSHAYALDEVTAEAYLGQPRDGSWVWQPMEGVSASLQRMIAIFQEESEPVLISMPVEVAR